MTDYASELLGGAGATATAKPAEPAGTDYAAQLTTPKGGAKDEAKTPKFDELDIANRDAGVMDKSVADFTTMAKAAAVDDPQTKLKIFAKARFPKDPKAIERYGFVDGEPVYLGEDDKVYRETPSGFTGWLKGAAAGMVGSPGATVGGIVGGVLGAPAGPVGTAVGSAVGAAGGKGYDKVGANLIFDEPQSAAGNAKAMATDAAFAAGGSVLGSALGKFLNRNVARDIGKLDPKAVADLEAKASNVGGTGVKVDLNAAQKTGVPSVVAKYDTLAVAPTSRDVIAADAQKTAAQAYRAADRFIEGFAKTDVPDEAGDLAKAGAKKVLGMIAAERSTAARPFYEKAFEGPAVAVTPELKDLMGRPAMSQALRRAKTLAANEGAPLQIGRDVPERIVDAITVDPAGAITAAGKTTIPAKPQEFSMRGLHYMKMALDDMIDGARESGMGNTGKRALVGIKENLLGIMDTASPDYAKAREIFAHMSPTVESVREGVVSRVAKLTDEQVNRAADIVFNREMSPRAVERTRMLFEKAGLKDDWNSMLAAYMRRTFEEAGKTTMTGGGAVTQTPKWAATLTGNPRQYRILEKAMDPQQFAAFNDMMDVFRAVGRTASAGEGSQTMPRQEALKAMQREVGGGPIGFVGKALTPQNWGYYIDQWIKEVRLGNHAEILANVITSPDGAKRLRELKQLSPRDQKFIAGMSNLFGISLAPKGVGAPDAQDASAPAEALRQ